MNMWTYDLKHWWLLKHSEKMFLASVWRPYETKNVMKKINIVHMNPVFMLNILSLRLTGKEALSSMCSSEHGFAVSHLHYAEICAPPMQL